MLKYVLAAIALLMLSGCRDPNSPQAVSGSVTFQGKPLDQGTIEFTAPDAPAPFAALISDGKYDIPAAQGLVPGNCKVRITSTEAFPITPEEYAAGKTAPPAKERIPEKYNAASQETVEVKSGNANRFGDRID